VGTRPARAGTQQAAERAERERETAEKRKLLGAMPPDVRKAYDAAQAAAQRRWLEKTKLGTLRLELETIACEHQELLRATGHQIRLIDMSRKIEKLLRSALYAENEAEAAAMFAKARKLRAAGEDLDEVPTALDLLKGLFPPPETL
jgi:hypothetical protein